MSEITNSMLLAGGRERHRPESRQGLPWSRVALLSLGFGILLTGVAGALVAALVPSLNPFSQRTTPVVSQPTKEPNPQDDPKDLEYRERLTAMQYYVTRQKGTERPGSGEYVNHKEQGSYRCVCCGAPLFDSKDKFDSRSGWPSFDRPHDDHNIKTAIDLSLTETRTEVMCRQCNAHLGHVFEDGPTATGQRYCINSAALKFEKGGSDSVAGR